MTRKRINRRRYIIDPEFQYSLIRKITLLAVMMIIMSMSVLAIVQYKYGDLQMQVIQPSPFSLSEEIDIITEEKTLLDLIWPVMAGSLLFALGITFFFGVLITHRMAGPVYRIRCTLEDMSEGHLSGWIQLRNKDEFKELAQQINSVKKYYRDKFRVLKELSNSIESEVNKIDKEHLLKLTSILSSITTD